MPCPINWCAFTWEAFSTLATGIVAVLGAVYIGIRQLALTREQGAIAARQTDLLEHQVNVDRAQVRADLFDRRLAIYRAIKDHMRSAIGPSFDFEAALDGTRGLAAILDEAEFLFDGEARKRLLQVAQEADRLIVARQDLLDHRQTHPLEGTDEHDWLKELSTRVRREMKLIHSRLDGLADAMGEEMKLYLPTVIAPAPSAVPSAPQDRS